MRAMVLAWLCGSSFAVWAAPETSLNVKDMSPSVSSDGQNTMEVQKAVKKRAFEEDKRITDLELKAQAGSLSRVSAKFNLGYSGPPVNQLSDPNKPNPDNRPGDNRTSLSGSMGVRVRLDSDSAVNLSTGVRWYTPYQAVKGEEVERPKGSKNYDISDPGASYDMTYALGASQMRSSFGFNKTTSDFYVGRGQWGNIGLGQSVKYTPGRGRLILGMQVSSDYYIYDREYRPSVGKVKGDGNVSKYYINFIPSVEYKLTDNLNFNTSLGYPYQNLRADGSWWRWSHPLTTWRVGVGWAIRRDIYINPYVNFFAEKPAFNTASLSFNTVFSIF